MSKRIVALLCVAAMLMVAFTFTGCGVKSTKTEVNGIKIEEQQYHSAYGNGVLLLLENKTGVDCSATVKVKFTNEGYVELSATYSETDDPDTEEDERSSTAPKSSRLVRMR